MPEVDWRMIPPLDAAPPKDTDSSEVRYVVPPPEKPFTHVRVVGSPTSRVRLVVHDIELSGPLRVGETVDLAGRLRSAVLHDFETNWPSQCSCKGLCRLTIADAFLQITAGIGGPGVTQDDLTRAQVLPGNRWTRVELVGPKGTRPVSLTYLNNYAKA